MGNDQKSRISDHKLLQSGLTLKEHSNMPQTNDKQKNQFERYQQFHHKKNDKIQGMDYLTVNGANNHLGYKNTHSVQIEKSQKIIAVSPKSSKPDNQQEDSLRATHIDAITKKSQMKQNHPSVFYMLSSDPRRSHKSVQHQRAYQEFKTGEDEGDKVIESRSECGFKHEEAYIITNNSNDNDLKNKNNPSADLQKHQQENCPNNFQQKSSLKVPSSIDDLDTIQLGQSNTGQFRRNAILASQNSTAYINNSNFNNRGYFLLTDTREGEKVVGIKQRQIQRQQQNEGTKQDDGGKPFNLTSWLSDVFVSSSKKQESQQQNNHPIDRGCGCNITMPIFNIFSSTSQITQNPQQPKAITTNQNQQEYQLPKCKVFHNENKNMKQRKQHATDEKQIMIKGVSKSY